ncbi:hypothetical protein [Cysteiniphilum sp. 6C5]|uniref:hypothetical protein n=1 Tax=unclassified Cysteiniphilum TaxID=2610889 RepID=UPI003F83B9DE
MVTLLGSILGFFSAMCPDLLAIFKDIQDKKHQLKLLQLKNINAEILADKEESKGLYHFYNHTQSKFVEALSASVRPVISYGFFFLYGLIKTFLFIRIYQHNHDAFIALSEIWTEQDYAIFAAIISFWFGYRAFRNNGRLMHYGK